MEIISFSSILIHNPLISFKLLYFPGSSPFIVYPFTTKYSVIVVINPLRRVYLLKIYVKNVMFK